MTELENRSVLVVGGGGFVGSNLVRRLLAAGVGHVRIVDNLLSAERVNVPNDERVRFTEGSIADDRVLSQVADEHDYVFHLATYHGNQSSIQNPLADHEHNQLTTLKLFEHTKMFRRAKKVVYAGAGCAVAEKL
jgi:nucleoside-diphosphate-sugar epimerase